MKTTLASAQRALKSLGQRGQTTRIPNSVRVVVLAYAREAHRSGETWAEIARNVGLSVTALHRWNGGEQNDGRQKGKLVPVVMSPPLGQPVPARETTLTLTTVGGERIEGLELDEAVRMVRALR